MTDSLVQDSGRETAGPARMEPYRAQVMALMDRLGTAIQGKRPVLEQVTVALISDGHVLLEDVPGTGKTTLAKALARLLDVDFTRVQFTPDLLPAELTGINVYRMSDSTFTFRPGPVFTNVLLADEINRATPRTQAALLECMEERQVTVDGATMPLEPPFIVLATQNPLETQGTFPLPEAQLDRFLMRLSLGYPERDAELEMLERWVDDNPLARLEPVLSRSVLASVQAAVRETYVSPAVRGYILDIIGATRLDENFRLGASPRASLSLTRAAQARAWLDGSDFVTPDHVKTEAVPVLAHRIQLRGAQTRTHSREQEEAIFRVLEEVAVPTEDWQRPSDSSGVDLATLKSSLEEAGAQD